MFLGGYVRKQVEKVHTYLAKLNGDSNASGLEYVIPGIFLVSLSFEILRK